MDSHSSPALLRSDQIVPPIPSLSSDQLSYSLAAANSPTFFVPNISRLAPPPKLSRSNRRPSTASSAEDKQNILPPAPPMGELTPSAFSTSTDSLVVGKTGSPDPKEGRSASYRDGSIQEMNRRAHAAVAGLRAEASRLAGVGAYTLLPASRSHSMRDRPHPRAHPDVLPSPFDPSPDEHAPLSQSASTVRDTNMVEPDYDWATFIHAYAMGRWDPLKTPLPPRSHLNVPSLSRTLDTSVGSISSDVIFDSPILDTVSDWRPAETPFEPPASRPPHPAPRPPELAPISEAHAHIMLPPADANLPPSLSSSTSRTGMTSIEGSASAGPSKPQKQLNIPLNLGPFSHRLRNSFADMRTSSGLHAHPIFESSRIPIPPADATATAAAIRLAAARVSVAPLALPSPEHELTDPMRGVTATIPGSHPDVLDVLPLLSPNTVRKSRLSSFWQGTQDVDDRAPGPESATIDTGEPEKAGGEPAVVLQNDDPPPPTQLHSEAPPAPQHPIPNKVVPPATAPVISSPEPPDDDYFGTVESVRFHNPPAPSAPLDSAPSVPSAPLSRPPTDISRQASAPPFDSDPQTVPALPRRICLTRQTSAPLPTASLYERRLRASRPASESSVNNLAGRAAKEEQMFIELGYLAPPNPPNELERRRALYKYNIWNTGRDPNFDRIAHLVKLVFNTRIVMITLIDGTEQ